MQVIEDYDVAHFELRRVVVHVAASIAASLWYLLLERLHQSRTCPFQMVSGPRVCLTWYKPSGSVAVASPKQLCGKLKYQPVSDGAARPPGGTSIAETSHAIC